MSVNVKYDVVVDFKKMNSEGLPLGEAQALADAFKAKFEDHHIEVVEHLIKEQA